MDLSAYRASAAEQQRTDDVLHLMPAAGTQALDIGARDGYFSLLMAERFDEVTALDLVEPEVNHPRVRCVEGNASDLPFSDATFDFVLCVEVLEHIPLSMLAEVCRELERVATRRLLIGVPYRQDLRVGRTTCYSCGGKNPPWGHVNSFDERRLAGLFSRCQVETVSFVGVNGAWTNGVSAALMDFAGNPYGTYEQEEPCIHCGQRLIAPPPRSVAQRLATRCAFWSRRITETLTPPRGNWLHMMLRRSNGDPGHMA